MTSTTLPPVASTLSPAVRSRTPSDILLTEEEEAKLAEPVEGEVARYWLKHSPRRGGALADIGEQERLRPGDAQPCFGDFYRQWYGTRNHVHGLDRGELAEMFHGYGCFSRVVEVHEMVLRRLGWWE